mmetsp:Transcript_59097/g.138263  ORF Transcript_59097/g.138263 Transcript_59097/m.138263 type:complete len:141 (-) Transcript_59097:263-685(-)
MVSQILLTVACGILWVSSGGSEGTPSSEGMCLLAACKEEDLRIRFLNWVVSLAVTRFPIFLKSSRFRHTGDDSPDVADWSWCVGLPGELLLGKCCSCRAGTISGRTGAGRIGCSTGDGDEVYGKYSETMGVISVSIVVLR